MLNNGHILAAEEMRSAEQALIDDGVSVDKLMQRAGQGAAQNIYRIAPDLPALVLCGPGNNGGDGYVIAEWLRSKDLEVVVAASAEPKSEAAVAAKNGWQGETIAIEEAEPAPIVIDCLFGTGLTRGLEGTLHHDFQRLLRGAQRRVAIDLPSGVHSDSGVILSEIPNFDLTVALGAYKPSHFIEPARSAMGSVIGVDIGIRAKSRTRLIERPALKAPTARDHKYSRGMVAVIAGEMTGAAELAALAALNAGAGYVKIFGPPGVRSPQSSIVTQHYANGDALKTLCSDDRISALVIGPGLGRSDDAPQIVEVVVNREKPMVIDADALMLLGGETAKRVSARHEPTVLTPHQGEFSVIAGEGEGSKIERTRAFAKRCLGCVVVKGADTVISDAHGRIAVSPLSSHWLSTAGTGDVLAGVIGARLASGADGFIAARQGQWLHSRAAQIAGPAFSAERLIDHLPSALAECL